MFPNPERLEIASEQLEMAANSLAKSWGWKRPATHQIAVCKRVLLQRIADRQAGCPAVWSYEKQADAALAAA
ncbi:hypothetical protein [Sinimarinibacterium sp. NLF-5-8]|uniref:hypothetical protein n=1 Tax=Sinimarinibacterium sp. NLF-5-8 TaxID=2698684 RepID=UPI00137C3347|nr:hypothetical protein [Sinimarinibacterium sp. NLF-5-8]QHS09058.1 hypothetical protein GT972_02120 [Sinimarinibacterium sp. NLF-5-8]